jgi:hypothetical protein
MHSDSPRTVASPAAKRIYPVLLMIGLGSLPYLIAVSSRGPGLSPDSLTYFRIASDLIRNGGTSMTIFPPGYPALIAAVTKLGSSLNLAAAIVNYLCLCVFIYCVYEICRTLPLSLTATVLVMLFLAGHPSMQSLWQMAWSEAAYMPLFAAFLYSAINPHKRTPRALALLLALSWSAMFCVRYAAIGMIPVALASLWMCATTARQRIEGAAVFGICILCPVLLIVAHNMSSDGSWLGSWRAPSEDTLVFALTQVAAAFKSWLVVAPQWRDFLPAWLLGTLAAGTVLFCLLRAPIEPGVASRAASLLAAAAVLHILLLIYAQISTVLDPIAERLLTPALMPIAILGGIIVDKWILVIAPSLRHRLATGIILISLACNYGYSVQRAAMIRHQGRGYNTTVVWEGDEVRKIKELSQQGYLVLSDDPLRLRYALSYSEWLNAGTLPGRPRYRQTGVDDGFAEFQENIVARGGVIVIWDQKQAWAVAAVASVPAHLQSANYQYAIYVVDRVR